MQIAAAGLEAKCFQRALAQYGQFELAECNFHAKQKSVVYQTRIGNFLVLIDQQTANQGTEFQQGVPITAVAGQAGCLDRQHRAGASVADRDEQALEALSGDAAAGATEIVIDNHNGVPTECFWLVPSAHTGDGGSRRCGQFDQPSTA